MYRLYVVNTLLYHIMGNTLDAPKRDKATRTGTHMSFSFGASAMQGWRIEMEDFHVCESLKDEISLFCVLDGHGGTFAAEYACKNLARILCQQQAFKDYQNATTQQQRNNKQQQRRINKNKTNLKNENHSIQLLTLALQHAFVDLDKEILLQQVGDLERVVVDQNSINEDDWDHHHVEEEYQMGETHDSSGTTLVAVLVTPHCIMCANVGDSRAILVTHGSVVLPLSVDHSPNTHEEEERIVKAGGTVHSGRVDGILAMSRALGDYEFKDTNLVMNNTTNKLLHAAQQKVSSLPDVVVHIRNQLEDKFIVMACDGIWDVLTNQECTDIVKTLFEQEGESNLGLICEELLDTCLKRGSRDNMTAIILQFQAQNVGQGGGVAKRRKQRLQK